MSQILKQRKKASKEEKPEADTSDDKVSQPAESYAAKMDWLLHTHTHSGFCGCLRKDKKADKKDYKWNLFVGTVAVLVIISVVLFGVGLHCV